MPCLEASDSDARIFRTPAEGGWPPAQNDYGLIHAEGIWVEQDPAEAVKWFRKAATGGHSRGQHGQAAAYHNGRGVERETTEAIRSYLMAAEQGFTVSQIAIGDDVFHRRRRRRGR